MPINKYKITSIEKTADGVKIFRMEPVDGNMIGFKPGQFAFIHILDSDGKTVLKRPYSIASAPDAPYLEFCIKIVHGSMTSHLDLFGVGSIVGIEGPMGHFFYGGQKTTAFIACGTGIAPMMSMLRHMAEKKLDGRFILFYSTKTRNIIIYKNEFEQLQKTNPSIKIVVTLTREENPQGWDGELGRINQAMINKYVVDTKNTDWWMCGSMEMIKGMKELLSGLGVDLKKVKVEGWG